MENYDTINSISEIVNVSIQKRGDKKSALIEFKDAQAAEKVYEAKLGGIDIG